MIRSELVQQLCTDFPDLTQREVEGVVSAITRNRSKQALGPIHIAGAAGVAERFGAGPTRGQGRCLHRSQDFIS